MTRNRSQVLHMFAPIHSLFVVAFLTLASCSAPGGTPLPSGPGSLTDATPQDAESGGPGAAYSEATRPPEPATAPTQVVRYTTAPPRMVLREPIDRPHLWTLVGSRFLEAPEWEGMDQQFSLGLTYDMPIREGLNVDVGGYLSEDRTTQNVGSTAILTTLRTRVTEFDLGLVKYFYPQGSRLRPYIGGGAALTWTRARIYRVTILDDSDFSPGAYGRGGLSYLLPGGGLLGLDFHYLGLTSVNIGGLSTDIDGWVGSISLGYEF